MPLLSKHFPWTIPLLAGNSLTKGRHFEANFDIEYYTHTDETCANYKKVFLGDELELLDHQNQLPAPHYEIFVTKF